MQVVATLNTAHLYWQPERSEPLKDTSRVRFSTCPLKLDIVYIVWFDSPLRWSDMQLLMHVAARKPDQESVLENRIQHVVPAVGFVLSALLESRAQA